MTTRTPIFIGVDTGAKEGDWNAEAIMERLPDGRVILHDVKRWRKTIDLEKNEYADGEAQDRKP